LMWQFSERIELSRGYIKKMSPAPSRRHQDYSRNLSFSILKIIEK